MMREEAISVTFDITRIGQKVYFQKILPRDTKRIIGLEYGAIQEYGEPLPVVPPVFGGADPFLQVKASKVIGKLNMQVAGRENCFLQCDLAENRNGHFGESVAAVLWQPKLWTHGRKREEINLAVNSDMTLVEGFFQDTWGVDEYEILEYKLCLYLWIEKCKA